MSQISVAILATGDELVTGDITNTNGQYIANQLDTNRILPGFHMTVADNEQHLIAAMQFLLQHHRALITIGGLGPTSDDLTRFALAKVLDKSLIFDNNSWQHIQQRLQKIGLNIPENNRQQCLFPQGATIIANENGTANACYIQYKNQDIFMLPGPPAECRSIFNQYLLPYLLKQDYQQPQVRLSWLLLGASEGDIASRLQTALADNDCQLAYRVDYPYLEVKLKCALPEQASTAIGKIKPLLQPYLISETRQTAADQLITAITDTPLSITIDDQATHGHLAAAILTPASYLYININHADPDTVDQHHPLYHVSISGLTAFWEGKTIDSEITLTLSHNHQSHTIHQAIRYRKQATLRNAIEYICWTLCCYLRPQ